MFTDQKKGIYQAYIHLVTAFNTYSSFIAEIAIRNWSFLQSKQRLARIFNKPHLIMKAYRRPKRLRDRAVSTKFKTSDNTPVPRGCEASTKPKCSWCKQINKIQLSHLPAVAIIRFFLNIFI